jgi:ribosomal protein L16 Arg81 hydroxylase
MKAPQETDTHQTFAFFKHNIKAVLQSRQVRKLGLPSTFEFENEHVQQVLKKALLPNKWRGKSVAMTCYLDGKAVTRDTELSKNLLQLLKSESWDQSFQAFPYSIQIRNVHKLSPQLYQFCYAFSQFMNWEYYLNVNLYMTPGSKRNCFEFHSDPHSSMIFQLQGKKKWLFPVLKAAHVSAHNPMRPLPKFDSQRLKKQVLQPNEWLFIPEGAIHKAEIQGNVPSLHLTFSLLTNRTHQGLADIFNRQIENTLDLQSLKYKNIDALQLGLLLQKMGRDMRDLFDQGNVDRWVRARNMVEFKKDLGINRPL